MALDQTRANEILTWMHGGAAPTALTAPIHVRIYTAVGTATTAGTEVATGGGYTAGGRRAHGDLRRGSGRDRRPPTRR